MDAEDALALADAIASEIGASVRSLGAIVALSSLVRPHIAGLFAFSSVAEQCSYISTACMALQPLTFGNEVYAQALCSFVIDNS